MAKIVKKVPLRKVLRFFGIDRAIAFTLLGPIWSSLAGPITIICIAAFFSPEQQGFYYTFLSLLGLQVFFELGFSYVVIQYASHEKAALTWSSRQTLEGDSAAKSRLASLLQLALIWYGCVAALVLLIVLPLGFIIFQPQATGNIQWQLPWCWFVIAAAANLGLLPIFAILQGCNLVAEVALMQLVQNVSTSLILWAALILQWGLLALALMQTFTFVWGLSWLLLTRRAFLLDLLHSLNKNYKINWWQEIWPFQWKVALSNFSAYLTGQLFGILLFTFQGAVAAGQLGLSTSVLVTIYLLGSAFVNTKIPTFGSLAARKDYLTLDKLFLKSLWQSCLVITLAGSIFWLAVFILYSFQHSFSQRLLQPLPLGLYLIILVVNQVMSVQTIYMRAHKQEPFFWLALINATLTATLAYFLVQSLAATGMLGSYLAVNLISGLGLGTWLFIRKWRLWHLGYE